MRLSAPWPFLSRPVTAPGVDPSPTRQLAVVVAAVVAIVQALQQHHWTVAWCSAGSRSSRSGSVAPVFDASVVGGESVFDAPEDSLGSAADPDFSIDDADV